MEFTLTTDHDEIRSWVEEHGGKPALKDKREDGRGFLDICFDEYDPDYQIISWEEFFDTFDGLNMIFRFDCLNNTCTEYSYTIINKNKDGSRNDSEDNANEMPEDVPIENVIPSASGSPDPDSPEDYIHYS